MRTVEYSNPLLRHCAEASMEVGVRSEAWLAHGYLSLGVGARKEGAQAQAVCAALCQTWSGVDI